MTEPVPVLDVRQLRALFTMSRELLQADKPGAALARADEQARRDEGDHVNIERNACALVQPGTWISRR